MSYGRSKDRYPMKYGDVLQSELATIKVHDWYSDGFPEWMEADMVYVDPPWSLGNANMFRGKAKRAYINDFVPYLDALMGWISRIGPTVLYMEMGLQNMDAVRKSLAALYPCVQIWPITYYKKHPCFLLRASVFRVDFDFTGLDDANTPKIAIGLEKPLVVADPCTGRGLSAMAALANGCKFVGTEMIPDKLSVCVERLTNIGQNFTLR
jgi:hypothetical protein